MGLDVRVQLEGAIGRTRRNRDRPVDCRNAGGHEEGRLPGSNAGQENRQRIGGQLLRPIDRECGCLSLSHLGWREGDVERYPRDLSRRHRVAAGQGAEEAGGDDAGDERRSAKGAVTGKGRVRSGQPVSEERRAEYDVWRSSLQLDPTGCRVDGGSGRRDQSYRRPPVSITVTRFRVARTPPPKRQ